MTGELVSAEQIAAALEPERCREAVEAALVAVARGLAPPPAVLGLATDGGGFHVKAALLGGERPLFATKVNANFPRNPVDHGLPTIQGVLVLMDARDGRVLAVMDSAELTARRTAAATAAATVALARAGARTATIIGCGVQGRASARALLAALTLDLVRVADADQAAATTLAATIRANGVNAEAARDHRAAARASDIVVTCTSSRAPILGPDDVRAGSFVAAVGADHPHKQEIDAELMARAVVIVDSFDQCSHMGDLHHALESGAVCAGHVRAELGEVLAGLKPGRLNDDEVIVFDSTGTAAQDVAAAAVVHETVNGGR